MATYIMLFRFTQQGAQDLKGIPARIDSSKKLFKKLGATVKEFYGVMGRYDIIIIAEAPNDEVIARCALAVGSFGNVRSETLRAFTEDEFRKMVTSGI